MHKPFLGTCYYPEHWSPNRWASDAQRMSNLGLSVVRIGEFAWSRIEPQPGQFDWQWLDQAIDTLAAAGLKIVLGTPTATPPRWMLARHPDMLAMDEDGQPRGFGSRRHYCFSHDGYRQESVRIATLMAERYAANPQIYGWQIDNEYGCHDTVLSYSDAAQRAFQRWLADRYQSIEELNHAWGNVFWSMEYDNFENVGLPNLTVTEANPAHVHDFRRFSSDQVIRYNRAQADAIRAHSHAPLIHNYMGRITDFNHFRLAEDLDIASWDAYPLGFLLDRSGADEQRQLAYQRQGEPDFQAFHHDLYRGVGRGRWWVMEQQPGPVNWAPYNPAPLPGMVRLWTWEAFAHQAEAVCYFRWRQAPFAQEQMHAGLLRPDSEPAPVMSEVVQVVDELANIGSIEPAAAPVAMVFDYSSCWAWETQPQGQSFDYFALQLALYRGLRRLGLSVDIVAPEIDALDAYQFVIVAGLMHWNPTLLAAIESFDGIVLVGPRSGSKTENFRIPESLPPALPGLNCKVAYVESLAPGAERPLQGGGYVQNWLEALETDVQVLERTADSAAQPVLVANENLHYLAGWPNDEAALRMLGQLCKAANINTHEMPPGVRQRCTASHRFLFNYNAFESQYDGVVLPAAGVHWQTL
ncbi:MAG: beta-galactosidase [Gammaproteobacteria bacterium]|nr:beta-galactosidase [Gammaproteobacteria bacterium]